MAAAFWTTNGAAARGPLSWRILASKPFPVPVSPRIRTAGGAPARSKAANRDTCSRNARIGGDSPISRSTTLERASGRMVCTKPLRRPMGRAVHRPCPSQSPEVVHQYQINPYATHPRRLNGDADFRVACPVASHRETVIGRREAETMNASAGQSRWVFAMATSVALCCGLVPGHPGAGHPEARLPGGPGDAGSRGHADGRRSEREPGCELSSHRWRALPRA